MDFQSIALPTELWYPVKRLQRYILFLFYKTILKNIFSFREFKQKTHANKPYICAAIQQNMRLILDFGNTFQKCAIFDDKELIVLKRFENIHLNDLKKLVSEYPKVKSAILSSVIDHDPEIIQWLKSSFVFIELNSTTPIPITNAYKTPETLGKDRLSAAIGAASIFPNQNVLSIDTGTAIKFDMVTKEGKYLGGSISPGLYLRFKALHTFTDKLPLVSYNNIHELIGNNTQSSILSGVMNGAIAEINGLITLYKQQFTHLKIVFTGGESIYFVKSIKSDIFVDSNLVVKGLNEILKFNEEK
ncbi:MAG: pantothenate kinase [Bacteroidetes bacterium]|nr:MAG: pantothenate kinase [Bacteroidota bacterium]